MASELYRAESDRQIVEKENTKFSSDEREFYILTRL